MGDKQERGSRTLVLSDSASLSSTNTRRNFLKMMAMGGAVVLLPSVVVSCSDDSDGITGPGSGNNVTIDFANGDIAVLQFAFALEQLEADFYTRVVANFASGFSAAERGILTDIRNHEVLHRDFLKAALDSNGNFTLTPTYGSLNFADRTAVLNAARDFEDLGVAAYNGAGQYIADGGYLTLAGKIVSVEARHASIIRDLLNPNAGGSASNPLGFAPTSFDNAFSPGTVATAAQGFIVDKLAFANVPSAFVQGPNGNGQENFI